MRSAIVAAPALLALAACQRGRLAETPPLPAEDACGASEAVQALNKHPPLRWPTVAAVAAILGGNKTIRVIKRGDAVTMDYRPDRLNLELDDSGGIGRVRCG